MTSRNYCYTIYFDEGDSHWSSWTEDLKVSEVAYYAGQQEICPKTGRRHLQLYVEFKAPQRGARIATIFGLGKELRYHGEQRRGSPQEASDYCTKEDSRAPGTEPHTHGRISRGQGNRSDLQSAAEAVSSGKRIRQIAEEHQATFVKFHKGLVALRGVLDAPGHGRIDKRVYVLSGPSRTGKTSWAYENVEAGQLYKVPLQSGTTAWFDGYDGEPFALIDDYRGEWPFQLLLRVLDHWPDKLPCKGGFVTWKPECIVITSNLEPASWYPSMDLAALDPLFKRITRCYLGSIPPPLRELYGGPASPDPGDADLEELLFDE